MGLEVSAIMAVLVMAFMVDPAMVFMAASVIMAARLGLHHPADSSVESAILAPLILHPTRFNLVMKSPSSRDSS